MSTPPPGLRPMSEFNPSQPGNLHDYLNDKMVPWTGEQAASWRRYSKRHPEGVMEWDGLLFDGWAEALGG
jgi:hypothetical protein